MKTDPIFPLTICVMGVATAMPPVLVAAIKGLTLLGIVGVGLATFVTFMMVWLYLVAHLFRTQRDQGDRNHSRTRQSLQRSKVSNRVRQALLDEVREETNDLNDRVADLEVTNSKVGAQHELTKRLQDRIGRLNHLVETGREKRSHTTLEDVYKLTGEIETPEPTFKEIDNVREENDQD